MISDEAAEPAETTNFNHTDVKPDTEHDDDAICCVEFLSSFPNVSFFSPNFFHSIPLLLLLLLPSQVGKQQ